MLRAATSRFAQRAALRTNTGASSVCPPPRVYYHASAKRDEEAAKPDAVEPTKPKGGLFGTGLNEWFALPIGIALACPLLQHEIYVVNEETQLVAVFTCFVVTVYTQAGGMIQKYFDDQREVILKEHNEAEDKIIEALEQKLDFLKTQGNMAADFESINAIREQTYVHLNKAGKVKPLHDFKAQVERMLSMIAQEETNVAEKAKASLMEEATTSVRSEFESSKELKKSALTYAIGRIKGSGGADPVQGAFVKFFKDKAAAAAKVDDTAEAEASRAAMVAKLNAVCKSEGFMFQFDEATGKPVMNA